MIVYRLYSGVARHHDDRKVGLCIESKNSEAFVHVYTPPGTPKQPTGNIIAVTRRGGKTATTDITRPTTNSDTQPASTGIWTNPTAPGTTPPTANSDTQLTNTQPTSTDISTPSAASAIPPLTTTRPTAKDVRTPTASLESPQHIFTASSRLSSSVLDLS